MALEWNSDGSISFEMVGLGQEHIRCNYIMNYKFDRRNWLIVDLVNSLKNHSLNDNFDSAVSSKTSILVQDDLLFNTRDFQMLFDPQGLFVNIAQKEVRPSLYHENLHGNSDHIIGFETLKFIWLHSSFTKIEV